MTEERARRILRLGNKDGFEAWIARQIWVRRVGSGWRVAKDGWTIDLAPVVPEGIRVAAFPPGLRPWPAVWVVRT
jgi:hypothetical protein